MTLLQLMMLGASTYFAFKIYEHIQTLQEPQSFDENEKGVNTFSPFSASELIEKADDSFNKNDYEKALALLLEADEKGAENSEVLFKIGYILEKKNSLDDALEYYKKASDLDRENEYIYNAIASIYRKNSEFISAKMNLNSSLAINSSNHITYYNYGNLLVDMKQPQEAIDMYKKALEVKPDFEEAQIELKKLEEQ